MKSLFTAFLLLLVFISCKNDTMPVSKGPYPTISVGVDDDGSYKILNKHMLKQQWEKQLAATGDVREISGFEINKGTAKGDNPVNYYLLTATCTDHKTSMSALLEMKEKYFYFNPDTASVICSGECGYGCKPTVLSKKKALYLICSDCADCIKTDFFINF